jgi:hypothetical protein
LSQSGQIELVCGVHRLVVADAGWEPDTSCFALVYHVGADKDYASSWHSITVTSNDEEFGNCLLIAGRGASGVHAHSAVCVGNRCYVAVGDALCALSIPTLTLEWDTVVDWATCFGVYEVPEFRCLLSHGECEISRVEFTGQIKWRTSGRDIFSEGFSHNGRFVDTTDFYKTTYRIDIETGQIVAELPAIKGE